MNWPIPAPNVWFSSDSHMGHANIITYCDRPFRDAFHMSKSLVARWNEVVLPDATVFYLGDFAMGNVEKNLEWAKQLNGTKFLIPGNHDKVFKNTSWYDRYCAAGFIIMPQDMTVTIEGRTIRLCHFPYRGHDRGGRDKYQDFCPVDDGGVLLHGHTHSQEKQRGNMIHVGVDAWDYYPCSWTQVKELIDADKHEDRVHPTSSTV